MSFFFRSAYPFDRPSDPYLLLLLPEKKNVQQPGRCGGAANANERNR